MLGRYGTIRDGLIMGDQFLSDVANLKNSLKLVSETLCQSPELLKLLSIEDFMLVQNLVKDYSFYCE